MNACCTEQLLVKKIKELNKIGISLTAQRDLDKLLKLILTKAKEFSNSDAGTLYLIENNQLHFRVTQNNQLNKNHADVDWPSIELYRENGEKNLGLTVTLCALTSMIINIEDVYNNEMFDFSGTKNFDKLSGYKTQSMLVIPLKNHKSEVIGVLQLINKIENSKIVPFNREDEELTLSLASQAGVVITRVKQEKELLNREKEERRRLREILDVSPNAIILFSDNIVKFANREFLNLIDDKDIIDREFDLDSILDKTHNFQDSNRVLSSFTKLCDTKRAIVKTKNFRKVFKVIKKDVNLYGNENENIYTLHDVTLQTYQELKITYYNQKLEYSLFKEIKKKNIEIVKSDESKEDNKLSCTDREILRKTHQNKISATEYINSLKEELGDSIVEDLEDLEDLEIELSNMIIELEKSKNISLLNKIGDILMKYCNHIRVLREFDDLVFTIQKISDLLININNEDSCYYQNNCKKILDYIFAIEQDLNSWSKTIFKEQNSIDIHYLDSSLLSSYLQIEMLLNDKDNDNIINDEDDFLELF